MVPPLNKLNILVLDHKKSDNNFIKISLNNLKLKSLLYVTSYSQTLESIENKTIDLLVVIISKNHDETTKNLISEVVNKVRGDLNTFKLPIVFISEHIDSQNIHHALTLGVTEYIVPPFTTELLYDRIQNALKLPLRNNTHYCINAKLDNFNKTARSEVTILAVDDVTENIEVIKGVLNNEYHLKAAKSADMAMKICLSDSAPDLILLDIMMPDIDGLTLCKMLKHNPLTQHIAVIFVTAVTGSEDMIRGLELGAVDYITKPIVPKLFLARINMHTELILEKYRLKSRITALENESTYK